MCVCLYAVCTPHEASFGWRLRSPSRVWSLVWLTCSSHQSSRCQKLHCTVRTSLREQSLARELPIQTDLTNPVVIQPDSGLPWTAQPARFLCQQLRAALCLRTSPSHHSQKTQAERARHLSHSSVRRPDPHPLTLLPVRLSSLLRSLVAMIKGVWVKTLEIRGEIQLLFLFFFFLFLLQKVVCTCVSGHVCSV